MTKKTIWLAMMLLCMSSGLSSLACADTIVLHDGASYSGQFTGAREGSILFTDSQGVEYRMPISDVASLVFSRTRPAPPVANGGGTKVIPTGTDIVILTGETIDSQNSSPGQLYSASIGEDVIDASSGVGIPQGSKAKLVVRNITTGGMVHSPEIVLDLFSVTVGGKEYRVVTNDVDLNSKTGVGGNKRTLEYGGGGAAIGGLLGGIFGGGKGAGIGLAAGAGGGLLTQIFTRGKKVQVPAESTLRFRLDRTLVLRYQN